MTIHQAPTIYRPRELHCCGRDKFGVPSYGGISEFESLVTCRDDKPEIAVSKFNRWVWAATHQNDEGMLFKAFAFSKEHARWRCMQKVWRYRDYGQVDDG